MSTELKMPALSPTMEEGTLAKWLVKAGDFVSAGDVLAEIETDKASMEIEAEEDGTVSEILVPEGSEGVLVGAVIALIAAGAKGSAPAPAAAAPAPVAAAPAPKPAEPAPAPKVEAAPAPAPAVVATPAIAAVNGAAQAKATPLARRIASVNGIDLGKINGSGPGGRIVKADLGLTPIVAPAAPGAAASAAAIAAPTYGPPAGVPFTAIKLTNMRKTIARRLTEAKQTIPHFYLSTDCRLDALLALRTELNAELADSGVKLSVNDFLIKALALALVEVPEANVQFAGDQIYSLERVDISLAVAIEGGLITPVITDAANKRLSTIAREAKSLAELARTGKLQPEQYQGGTASLSNLGMFGVRNIFPVINPPQAMILGVGAGEERPYAVKGELTVATVMTATASFDHRAIDGAVGAQFMSALRTLIERPVKMIA